MNYKNLLILVAGGLVLAVAGRLVLGEDYYQDSFSDSSAYTSAQAVEQAPPVTDPAKVATLKEQILSLDKKGQKTLKTAIPHLEKYVDSGSNASLAKVIEAAMVIRNVTTDLNNIASNNSGVTSILDTSPTLPGEDSGKSGEQKCAEAARSYAMAYEYWLEALDKASQSDGATFDKKAYRDLKNVLNNASTMRLQGELELASVE